MEFRCATLYQPVHVTDLKGIHMVSHLTTQDVILCCSQTYHKSGLHLRLAAFQDLLLSTVGLGTWRTESLGCEVLVPQVGLLHPENINGLPKTNRTIFASWMKLGGSKTEPLHNHPFHVDMLRGRGRLS